jgi:hypothetical protein
MWVNKEVENHNYKQWHQKAKKTWTNMYATSRRAWGPKPGYSAGEPYWNKEQEAHFNQTEEPYEPFPAKEMEKPEPEPASSSGLIRPSTIDRAEATGQPSISTEVKIEDEPRQEWRDAVDSMRKHQRMHWQKICRGEIARSVQRMAEDGEDGKAAKERREPTPKRVVGNPVVIDDVSEASAGEGTRTATRSPTTTSCVSSGEAERSAAKHREESKKPELPKDKKRKRLRSITPSDATYEVEGGANIQVGRQGGGRYKISIVKIANK